LVFVLSVLKIARGGNLEVVGDWRFGGKVIIISVPMSGERQQEQTRTFLQYEVFQSKTAYGTKGGYIEGDSNKELLVSGTQRLWL
jgi:hypothetical protein